MQGVSEWGEILDIWTEAMYYNNALLTWQMETQGVYYSLFSNPRTKYNTAPYMLLNDTLHKCK